MDQFSHDLTVALEETSLLDRARVSRWGQQRRRTCSTGNLPCAPQPTEDSSSPTDAAQGRLVVSTTINNDGLDTHNINLPQSDSDDKDNVVVLPRLPGKPPNATALRLGTLESDSLNENFSPARFFKPNARRKRKLKRIPMDYEISAAHLMGDEDVNNTTTMTLNSAGALKEALNASSACTAAPILPTIMSSSSGTIRKRLLKTDSNCRSQMFFCGKRKRSNRDRYHDHGGDYAIPNSMPRHHSNHMGEYRMRPRSFSSTSKPHSDRLLPLNKGLLSKIERISQQQKSDNEMGTLTNEQYIPKAIATTTTAATTMTIPTILNKSKESCEKIVLIDAELLNQELLNNSQQQQQQKTCSITTEKLNLKREFTHNTQSRPYQHSRTHSHHLQHHHHHRHQRQRRRLLQFPVDPNFMDCEDLHEFSSSSLSSSESDDNHATNDTDREGDDELTDWPGNEFGTGSDGKRKLTKRSTLPQIKSDPESLSALLMTEDDTLMSLGPATGISSSGIEWPSSSMDDTRLELPYQSSEPITIAGRSPAIGGSDMRATSMDDINIPLKQIESEMSGETSNPFLSSPPCQPSEVREIRAGCRRVKGERPGFSIKTSVNERLARFLQDPRQLQIRLPDVEIYEHESLVNLATLYSLQMTLDNGCAVLNKTSNTTQSVNIDRQGLQSRLLLSDFKRRCYDSKEAELLLRK